MSSDLEALFQVSNSCVESCLPVYYFECAWVWLSAVVDDGEEEEKEEKVGFTISGTRSRSVSQASFEPSLSRIARCIGLNTGKRCR
jgi:hypothetical protein